MGAEGTHLMVIGKRKEKRKDPETKCTIPVNVPIDVLPPSRLYLLKFPHLPTMPSNY
jgi:hypothetical protein